MTIKVLFKDTERECFRFRKVDKLEFDKKSKYWIITLKDGKERFINSRIYNIKEERLK